MARIPWKSLVVGATRRAVGVLVQRSTSPHPSPGSSPTTTTPGRSNTSPTPRPPATTEKRAKTVPPVEGSGTTSGAYPGDYTGTVRPEYSPSLDGEPDPGEIVWTWVPFEEDFERGKDRPVLVIGRDGAWLLGLMLSSKDHSRDAADEARWGREWLDIGTGPWDPKGRESEVRLDRVVRIDPAAVRREGAIMDEATFTRIVARAR